MMRIGFGYDVHPLVEEREFVMGGVMIPFEKGLLGHSDADILCHAIGDALLGGAALGDIGSHFPDDNPRYAGISSLLLLKEIGEMISEEGFEINNIDTTVACEKPKLQTYIPEMRKNIAEALSILESQVSIKATTSEKMGFVGEGQGIVTFATVLIQERD